MYRCAATSLRDDAVPTLLAQIHDMYCRSQIDGSHPDLPGQAFDIKSRSVLPLRYDVLSKQAGLDYKIEHLEGLERSVRTMTARSEHALTRDQFERETFDLIRLSYLNWRCARSRTGNNDLV
jgi:hypothetical protein